MKTQDSINATLRVVMPIFSKLGSQRESSAPLSRYTAERRRDRAVDELVGISRGVLADGDVNLQEIQFLMAWLNANREFANDWPFNSLIDRVCDAVSDGDVDDEEEKDILDALLRLGGNSATLAAIPTSGSTSLPLDEPQPPIIFEGRMFVVTGVFGWGSRSAVTQAIEQRRGSVRAAVSAKTQFLIVGSVGSEDWIHSSYGRKIERALELRSEGHGVAIVSESHWERFL